MKYIFSITAFFVLLFYSAYPQENETDTIPGDTTATAAEDTVSYVIFNKDTLFPLREGIGAFLAEERAEAIQARLNRLVSEGRFESGDTLVIVRDSLLYKIMHGEAIIMVVTQNDAASAGSTQEELALQIKSRIEEALNDRSTTKTILMILLNVGLLIVAIAALWGIFYVERKFFNWINKKVVSIKTKVFEKREGVFKLLSLISPEGQRRFLLTLLKLIRLLVIIATILIYLPIVFAVLPWTQPLFKKIYVYVVDPLKQMMQNFLEFIPALIFIIVMILITKYFIRFLAWLKDQVEDENISIKGFYPDWAQPTFFILRVVIWIIAIIIIYPYIPGTDTAAFQGLSIFLGVLISLGSTSAIANIVAGIVITYMRSFRIGDRVKINETVGDVIDKTLLVTKIRTIKNVEVTIPNATIINNHLLNYTRNAEKYGLIVNTSVTIGYDVPWKKVQELLISAAKNTELLEETPEPFVLQVSLDDFYVKYELNAYTHKPNKTAVIYSDLHKHILDNFNEANIEILSPHYSAIRDGNDLTIPHENKPEGYEKPGFKIENPLKNIINPGNPDQ